jgi:hypothetical protein
VALAKSLHARFLRGTEKRASCKRLEWARVRCRVAWRLGGQRYRGTFTIELEVKGYRVLPRARISINSSIA